MTVYGKPVQLVGGSGVTNNGLPVRDGVLRGGNGGCGWIADYDWTYSFARQAPPVANDALIDAGAIGNGRVELVAGQAIGFAGGGFDYSALTARGSYDEIPASFASAIWSDGAAGQHLGALLYVRIPAEEDWAGATAYPFLSFNSASNTFEVFWLGQVLSGGVLKYLRLIVPNGASTVVLNIQPSSVEFGKMMQIMISKTAAGVVFQTRSEAGGLQVATNAAVADSATNFSSRIGRFGVSSLNWPSPLSGAGAAKNFRTYRRVLFNKRLDTRDMIAVADADWKRVMARKAKSAAANGGVSAIFV